MNLEQKNILIIDDSATVRNFVTNILGQANYNVYAASNGEEGIELYKKLGNIDLVITDIYMPKKTGIEVIMELKVEHEDLKVIIFSDGGKENFSNDSGICEALGAAYFLKKDSVKDELVNLVDKIFLK